MERIRKTGGSAVSAVFSDIPGFGVAEGFGIVYSEGLYRMFLTVKRGLFFDVAQYVSEDLRSWKRLADAVSGERRIDSVSAVVRNGKIFLVYVCGLNGKCKLAQSRDGENFETYPLAVIRKGAPRRAKLTYSGGAFYLTGNSVKGEICAFRSPNCIVWEPHNIKLEGFDGEVEYPNFIGVPGGCFMFYARSGKTYRIGGKLDAEGGRFVAEGDAVFFDNACPVRTVMLGPDRPLLYARFASSVVFREMTTGAGGVGWRAPVALLEARKYTGGVSGAEAAECFEPKDMPATECAYAFAVQLSKASEISVTFASASGGKLTVGVDKEKAVVSCRYGDTYTEYPFEGAELRFDAVLRRGYSEVFVADGKYAITLPAVAAVGRTMSVSANGLAYVDYSCYEI